jgi:hypothetical protein
MSILFFALALFGLLSAVATASLIIGTARALAFAGVQALAVVVALPLVINTPMPVLLAIPHHPHTLVNLSLVVLIENLVALFMTMAVLRAHWGLAPVRAGFAFFLPSLSAATGFVFAMAMIINKTTGTSYVLIAAGVFAGAVALVFSGGMIARAVLASWDTRLELKAMLSILAVVIAAAVPLLHTKSTIMGTPVTISLHALGILGIVLSTGVVIGFALHFMKEKRRRKRELA